MDCTLDVAFTLRGANISITLGAKLFTNAVFTLVGVKYTFNKFKFNNFAKLIIVYLKI